MSDQGSLSALVDERSVKEFSSRLLDLAGLLQAKLHHLSGFDRSFAVSGYGVLMEVYGLRTRAYILLNDSGSHVVDSLGFSQDELVSLFDRVAVAVRSLENLTAVHSIVISVATFTMSLGADRGKVVNFLFESLCDDVARFESSLF
ncbi:hypothetical protein [Pseudomonas aeruginosa]|uniref:hypothetical protein n=1 Tax=Pseudomonas aeruginosa TaxID=287 RepID=UPI0011BE9800|nr:hypothetical protein [Pseudomonas aeruginosa]